MYIGTSGFSLQKFYPSTVPNAERLAYYATVFPTVEINSTFYHIPRSSTLDAWQQHTSSDFTFTFKIHKEITHTKDRHINIDLLPQWVRLFERFGSTIPQHIMLFQFPASYAHCLEDLEKVLHILPQTFLYAFEFRHTSWFHKDTYDMLSAAHASLVFSDSPVNANGSFLWPQVDNPRNAFVYIRFHGSPNVYASSYSDDDLKKYAMFMQQKSAQGKAVYAYFNNDAQAHAAENALALQNMVKDVV